MNIDVGSPVLDIAIGLSFVFFLLSVIASSINELIAGVMNLRGKTLESGLLGMIGDAEAVDRLLDHPLVRTELDKKPRKEAKKVNRFWLWFEGLWPRSKRNYERASSYLAAAIFAAAFHVIYDELKGKKPKEVEGETLARTKAKRTGMEEQVKALAGPPTDGESSRHQRLEEWFDSGMERVSGWYKRKSQIFLVLIAILVAVGMNANTLRIAQKLEQDPATRSSVVAAAESAATKPLTEGQREAEKTKAKAEGKSLAQVEIEGAVTHASAATKEITVLGLPLLWGAENNPSTVSWEENAVGWLLTVIAISLGAPFWFDALGRLANLRSAGKKPEEATGAGGAK